MTSEEDGSARHQPNTECADPPKVRLFTTKTRISRKKKIHLYLESCFHARTRRATCTFHSPGADAAMGNCEAQLDHPTGSAIDDFA